MKTEIKTMRDVFIDEIYKRMHYDDRIFFLCADFGSPKLDKLKSKFKNRFLNVGIAEQNLINISTGLALEGFTIYAYAIAPFLTMRAYEQIRVNLSIFSQLKEININLIGVGAGLSYDVSGPTHHCLEDITIMRLLPNFTVFSPSDWVLAKRFMDFSLQEKNPKYLRFDNKALPQIYKETDKIKLKSGFFQLRKGKKICLIATGYFSHKAVKIANMLERENFHIGVIDVFLLKPLDEDLFFSAIKEYDGIITLEEGFINNGGLDSLVASILDTRNSNIKLERIGFRNAYVFDIGNREYLHRLNNVDEDSIIKNIIRMKSSILL